MASERDHAAYRVPPGERVRLADHDPGATGPYSSKKDVEAPLARCRERIADVQARLYAEHRRGLLVVLQAMDTGGKDGTIKGVFRGVNPQGCVVWSFKVPTDEERAHDFLWRYHRRAPERGLITIFNRSHYEDVIVPRVRRLAEESLWQTRYGVIRDFERGLAADGITIVKFFLHISKDEQRRRLERRLADPSRCWKFSAEDVHDRALWDDYQSAYQDALAATSADVAPWYVVPADRKWFRNLVIARTIADTLADRDPRFPGCDPALARMEIPG
jgi:PPK2 family polyphosphate:nucleotide phosphotransferase